MILRRSIPIITLGLLAACGRSTPDVDALDRELVGNLATDNQTDPALTSALADQIMVDPALAQQANDHSVRPADAPVQAPIPPGVEPGGEPGPGAASRPTLGQLARQQAQRAKQPADCYASLSYSHAWANRLPAGVPLYADAAVTEAAGNDTPGCRTRVVSYATAAPLAALVRFYLGQARRAGYSAEYARRNGDHVVAGERGDGGAFYLTIAPRTANGSDVDIVANNGR